MKKQKYLTVKQNGFHEIDIKKSQFIGYVKRVQNDKEAKDFIKEIKNLNKKATHNCYAYMVGLDDHIQRKSDNGEPSGTAGLPILDGLKLKSLHNTAVVVTRYFGGIKLGAGGLIRAYSNATSEAINHVGVVQRILQTQIDLTVNYNLFNSLKYYLEQNKYNILNTQYTTNVKISVAVNTPNINDFKNKIINLLNDRVEITKGSERYFEVDYQQNADIHNNKKD